MNDARRREAIRAYCTARRIDTLVHFTRLENLAGILEDGILPRSALEGQASKDIFNDNIRTDGHKDAACISISFPNYKMFYKYRQTDQTATWAVLLIRPEVLWELDCAFCSANAASSAMSRLSTAVLKDSSSLVKMFADKCEVSGIHRAECDIPDWYPTNPQAEVLVFSGVPLSYVTAAYFNDRGGKSKFQSLQVVSVAVDIKSTFFSARSDWQVWKQAAEVSTGESWQNAPSSIPF